MRLSERIGVIWNNKTFICYINCYIKLNKTDENVSVKVELHRKNSPFETGLFEIKFNCRLVNLPVTCRMSSHFKDSGIECFDFLIDVVLFIDIVIGVSHEGGNVFLARACCGHPG